MVFTWLHVIFSESHFCPKYLLQLLYIINLFRNKGKPLLQGTKQKMLLYFEESIWVLIKLLLNDIKKKKKV